MFLEGTTDSIIIIIIIIVVVLGSFTKSYQENSGFMNIVHYRHVT